MTLVWTDNSNHEQAFAIRRKSAWARLTSTGRGTLPPEIQKAGHSRNSVPISADDLVCS
jgi:hypothetical protein